MREGGGRQSDTSPPPSLLPSSTHKNKFPSLQIADFVFCFVPTSPDQPADMRDEFSQILDSVWEETLPGNARLCLADMKVKSLSLYRTTQYYPPIWNQIEMKKNCLTLCLLLPAQYSLKLSRKCWSPWVSSCPTTG